MFDINWSLAVFQVKNKPKQIFFIFDVFSFAVIGACGVDKHPHIFGTRANQHIIEINTHFDENLNHFGPMIFVEDQ